MEITDFARHIGHYLKLTLPGEIGASARTVDSYKLAFVQFLEFMEANSFKPEDITLDQLTRQRVVQFLDWLEEKKGNSVPTRNQKLAAFKGFAKYLEMECPEHLAECIGIRSIPVKKYSPKPISYLNSEGVKALTSQVNPHANNGLRDLLMIALLSCLGLRASELAELKVKDIQLGSPPRLIVHGKGGKTRPVPILKAVRPCLEDYLKAYGIDSVRDGEEPLFKNHLREKFTRQGIHFLVKKYADKAREGHPDLIPADLSPHKLRHTTAMELLASGVDLIYIRDLLGHSSVTTTEIYAKANSKLKLQALEKATRKIGPLEEPKWVGNKSLTDWLKSL